MKKSLIALAVAGALAPAFAQAQNSVTIYGIADFGYKNTKTDFNIGSNPSVNTKTSNTADLSNYTPSRLGFKGSEDLGGNLKANFNFEFGMTDGTSSTDPAAPLTQRLANVGLSGGFGSLTLGRQWSLADNIWAIGSAGGRNSVAGALYTASTITFTAPSTATLTGFKGSATRNDRLITYETPNFGGVKVGLQYGRDKTTTTGLAEASTTVSEASVAYGVGAFNIGVAYDQQRVKTTAPADTETKDWVLGVNYDFNVVKLYGLYTDVEVTNKVSGVKTNDRKGWELGVAIPVNQFNFIVSYYDGRDQLSGSKLDVDGYQLNALYNLSKRTMAYGVYGRQNGKNNDLGAKLKTDVWTVGLRHIF